MVLPKRSSQINLFKDSKLLIEDLKMERVVIRPRLVLTTMPVIADTHKKKQNLSILHMKSKKICLANINANEKTHI